MRDMLSENLSEPETKIESQVNSNAKTPSIDFQLTTADVPRLGFSYSRLDKHAMPDLHTIQLLFMDTEITIHGDDLLPLYHRIRRHVQPEVKVNDEHHDGKSGCFVTEITVKQE